MLIKVDQFSGSANILGNVCRVEFNAQGLTLHGLTFDQAREALAALDLGAFVASRVDARPSA